MNKNGKSNAVATIEEKVISNLAVIKDVQNFEIILQPVEKTEVYPVQETAAKPEPLTVEELKSKLVRGAQLGERHDELTGKLNRFKEFQFSENAQVRIQDDRGINFVTHNERIVKRFFEVCSEEYGNAIQGIETELKSLNF